VPCFGEKQKKGRRRIPKPGLTEGRIGNKIKDTGIYQKERTPSKKEGKSWTQAVVKYPVEVVNPACGRWLENGCIIHEKEEHQ
jgi:hypothetical protein